VYLLITQCTSCITQPSRAFAAHNSTVFIAYPPGQGFSVWPAKRNRMFSSSVSNTVTKCRAPNGSQIYWDSARQDVKKITSETTLSPSEKGTQPPPPTQQKKAFAANQKALKGSYGHERPF